MLKLKVKVTACTRALSGHAWNILFAFLESTLC